MKKIIFLCFFTFCINASSEELNGFSDRYPTILSFQSILLQQFKNYFESLKAKSVIYNFGNSKKLLRYTDPTSGKVFDIRLSIDRIYKNNTLFERATYTLENSESFIVEYNRVGHELIPSSDEDLMTLKMKPQLTEEFFSIKLPSVKQGLFFEKDKKREISYILIGTFEFNLKIEKLLDSQKPKINYLFFFKGMDNPQSFLTVVSEVDEDTGANIFIHQSIGGLITPKDFFTGISQASGAFIGAAQESKEILLSKGFPKL